MRGGKISTWAVPVCFSNSSLEHTFLSHAQCLLSCRARNKAASVASKG